MAARLIAHLLDDHREVEQIFAGVLFPMAARLLSAERDAHLREQAAAIEL